MQTNSYSNYQSGSKNIDKLIQLRHNVQNNAVSEDDLPQRMWTPERSGSFFVRLYFGSERQPDEHGSFSFTQRIENISRMYMKIRDELLENHGDNPDELYRQLGELNTAFEGALRSIAGLSVGVPKQRILPLTVTYTEADKAAFERKYREAEQFNQAIRNVFQNFSNNMLRHMDAFFISFIEYAKDNDFDTAFGNSMAHLNAAETTSLEEISFTDMLKIVETLQNRAVEFDDEGRPVRFRYATFEDALWALARNQDISAIITDHMMMILRG